MNRGWWKKRTGPATIAIITIIPLTDCVRVYQQLGHEDRSKLITSAVQADNAGRYSITTSSNNINPGSASNTILMHKQTRRVVLMVSGVIALLL